MLEQKTRDDGVGSRLTVISRLSLSSKKEAKEKMGTAVSGKELRAGEQDRALSRWMGERAT